MAVLQMKTHLLISSGDFYVLILPFYYVLIITMVHYNTVVIHH